MKRTSDFFRVVKKISIVFFTFAGITFVGVFFAMRFGFLNVKGSIEDRNKFFTQIDQGKILNNKDIDTQNSIITCEVNVISKNNKILAGDILSIWYKKNDINLSSSMINSAISQIYLIDPKISESIKSCLNNTQINTITEKSVYPWANTPDWIVISNGLTKDESIIRQVSLETGVPARLIISAVIPEQFRFFSSNRESYKKYFEPLKILGTLTQFSLGVSGIKPDTANEIEKNNTDPASEFYLGPQYEHSLDYAVGVDHDTELYNRLTDTKNHYYQYLYTAFFLKQIERQWLNNGYDLSYRPDILGTIFNLGFYKSKPSASPEVGGAVIKAGDDESISFGEVSYEFYFSGELLNNFPF